jgi:hypothetical protein
MNISAELHDKLSIVSERLGCEPAEIAQQILEFGIEMEFLRCLAFETHKKEKEKTPPTPPKKEKEKTIINNIKEKAYGGGESEGRNQKLGGLRLSPLEAKAKAKANRKKQVVNMPKKWVDDRESDTISDEHLIDYADKQGYDWYQARDLFLHFVDHHQAKGNKFANWQAAWRTWLRNDQKFNGKPKVKSLDPVLRSRVKKSNVEEMFND